MAHRKGSSLFSAVLAVAGVAALGVLGYRMMGGCTSCETGTNAALVAETTKADGCCALGNATKVATSEKSGCCGSGVTQVAKTEGSCGDKTACTEKASCGEKSACTSGVSQVNATTAKTCAEATCTEKTACKEGKDGCTGDGKNGCCGDTKCSEAAKAAGNTEPGKGS
ncbi:hypothetical protein J4558_08195 [Leptolyngbya sp. 15MV]|nr:hypothetical protein J4558_08195 [Leptolyngbya sp. 15MV]